MHLLAAQPGTVDDGSEAVDLDQTPGEVVFLTAADSEIAALSAAQHWRLSEDPSTPSLRLVNLMQLGHNLSVDLYIESVVSQAKLVIVRLLGGRGYWPYGVENNRIALENATRYSYEQGLSSRKLDIEELFAPSTLEQWKS